MADRRNRKKYDGSNSPQPLGVTIRDQIVTFAVSVPNAKECRLKLYQSDREHLFRDIRLTQEHQKGSVFSYSIPLSELNADRYVYEALNKEFIDPYAVHIVGRDTFGQAVKPKTLLGAWNFESYDWQQDSFPDIDYSDMILYKAHVRGFTADKSSGVRHKGTYQGIIEKITYLKELGINAMFLMPCVDFNEQLHQRDSLFGIPQYTRQYVTKGYYQTQNEYGQTDGRLNYWGYTEDAYYFAPKASYASKPSECIREFKNMVKALHKNGIELIMDMEFSRTIPPVMVLDCLRYWVSAYHVDGFRIHVDENVQNLIAMDPYLAGTKLFAQGWNTELIYGREVEPPVRKLAEYNSGFMSDVRRFLKGDEEQVLRFIDRLKKNGVKSATINYITDHNGFTLNDLYQYDVKHNEVNQENNHDGTDYNFSWNCGVEGPSKKKKVRELRIRMMKNAYTALLLSQGTPMLLSGDEFLNSQEGNNNAYCQDNETGWVNWNKTSYSKEMITFVKQLIELRKQHPIFHNPNELRGMDYISCGTPDISFHGTKAWYPDYSNYSRTIGVMLSGEYAMVDHTTADQSCYLVYNMHWETHTFDLPHLIRGREWEVVWMTEACACKLKSVATQKQIELGPRSMAVLMSRSTATKKE